MTKYILEVPGYIHATVRVDIDDTNVDPDEVSELVITRADMPSLCAQCSGWGQEHSLELGEDWNWDKAEVRKEESE